MSTKQHTRHSLLQRASALQDEQAWVDFEQQYRRFIFYALQQLGVVQDDLEDLTQQILIALTKDLHRYDKSRASFRSWLSVVIRNNAHSYFRKRMSAQRRLDSFAHDSDRNPVMADPAIDKIIEKEWATYVASLAMTRVQQVFKGQAIEVFELSLDGHSAAAIAEKTQLSIASVYTLKKRVKKRLYLEIRSVAEELEL